MVAALFSIVLVTYSVLTGVAYALMYQQQQQDDEFFFYFVVALWPLTLPAWAGIRLVSAVRLARAARVVPSARVVRR